MLANSAPTMKKQARIKVSKVSDSQKVSVSGRRMLDVQIDAGPHFFIFFGLRCIAPKKCTKALFGKKK